MILNGAESFFLQGGTHGVLLVHGFTGSPSEMVLFGDYLHKKGYTKEQITLVTNNAYQEAILENWDLRGADGAIFSSHSLLEKVNNLFNLKQYEHFQEKTGTFPGGTDFLADRIAAIESGSIVIITKEADE